MRVSLAEVRAILDAADKTFKMTFWEELRGLEVVHEQYGRGTISSVEGSCVHVVHGGDLRTYSASVLHSYITDLPELPDDGIAAPSIMFDRRIEEISDRWALPRSCAYGVLTQTRWFARPGS